MARKRFIIPGVDTRLLIKDALKVMPDPSRRKFLTGGASLGALALLTGCNVVDSDSAESVLRKMSEFNDGVQAAIFNPNALAPTYSEADVRRPFPFNAYYDVSEAPEVDGKTVRAGSLRPRRQQEVLDARRALRAAAGKADHAAHLRGGLECHRKLDGYAPVRLPQTCRRRHACEICLVPLRRGLSHHHRHADRAASANPDDVQIR